VAVVDVVEVENDVEIVVLVEVRVKTLVPV
jgi:hypothetical protein